MDCIKCDICGKVLRRNYTDYVVTQFCNSEIDERKDLCIDCFHKTIDYIENNPLKTPKRLFGSEKRLLHVLVEIYHDKAADGLTVVDMLNRIIEHELGEGYRIVRK